jgi:hypothetical protein
VPGLDCSIGLLATTGFVPCGVRGRARPICDDGHSEVVLGGDLTDGISVDWIAVNFFSDSARDEVDLPLLDLLLSFSPFPAMTNSG